MPNAERLTAAGKAIAWVLLHAAALALGTPAPCVAAENGLNPRRAHARVPLISDAGYRVPPQVRFYASPNLRGAAALELNGQGFIDRGNPVCVWRPEPSLVSAAPGELWLRVKVFAGQPCEHELYPDQPWAVLGEGWTHDASFGIRHSAFAIDHQAGSSLANLASNFFCPTELKRTVIL